MARSLMLLLLLLLGSVLLVYAEEEPPAGAEPITATPAPGEPALFGPLQGVWQMVEAERVTEPVFPSSPTDHGSDFCETIIDPNLDLRSGAAGDLLVTNNMSESASDPVLSCMYGSPVSPRGFRTVWYKFVAPISGELVVFTDFLPSDYEDSYDTVLALYESSGGTCATLQMLACSDDYHGFFSQVSQFVIEGRTYYIEVADWHFSAQEANYLRLAVVLAEGASFWTGGTWDEYWLPRSRHMVVTDGTYIYVIGGEVDIIPFPERTRSTLRFNPATGEWTPLPESDMPPGYSRTDAAYLNGKIYVPSGYVGNNNAYAGGHFTFDTAQGVWLPENDDPPVPWATASPSGQAYGWIQAVAVPQQNGYYVVGGLLSGNPDPSPPSDVQPTSRLLFYNAGSRSWATNLPDMATARYAHVADLVPTPRGPELCVTGGIGPVDAEGSATLWRTTECYNVSSGSWSERAPLNLARYAADSAVGPDGRWYVFGGINAQRMPVALTEVYNPTTDSWQVLDSRYAITNPGRALAQGVFVGTTLWVFGGETVPGQDVVPLMQQLQQPQQPQGFMPLFRTAAIEPGDTIAEAWPIALHEEQWHNFAPQEDYFDFFRFDIPAPGRYEVEVTNIPPSHDYDLYLYDSNKHPVGSSVKVGNQNELAETVPLVTGRPYYAAVVRVGGEPTGEHYRIVVRPQTP